MTERDRSKKVEWAKGIFRDWNGKMVTDLDRENAILVFRKAGLMSYSLSKPAIRTAFEWLIDNTISKENTDAEAVDKRG